MNFEEAYNEGCPHYIFYNDEIVVKSADIKELFSVLSKHKKRGTYTFFVAAKPGEPGLIFNGAELVHTYPDDHVYYEVKTTIAELKEGIATDARVMLGMLF